LNALCRKQKAIGAYDLAAAHQKESGRRTEAYGIYRALEFLEAQGLVAHLAGTRTFVACTPRQGIETSLFFVCSKCGLTSERRDPDVEKMIHLAADAIGFHARVRAIDVEGVCKKCSQDRGEHITPLLFDQFCLSITTATPTNRPSDGRRR
jgi:Fur family zinc uptake transcriptional regulator